MTNTEVKALKVGDRITLYDFDRVREPRVRTGSVVRIEERRGGHFPEKNQDEWAIVKTADDTFVIESDSYITSMGYDTHAGDAGTNQRLRGAEFTQQKQYGMFSGLFPKIT